MSQELGEQYGSTLVLTLVTGQMVTLDAARARIGSQRLSETGGLERLEWLLSGSHEQTDQPGARCVVELDEHGQPMRFFPPHAIVSVRIDPYPLTE